MEHLAIFETNKYTFLSGESGRRAKSYYIIKVIILTVKNNEAASLTIKCFCA